MKLHWQTYANNICKPSCLCANEENTMCYQKLFIRIARIRRTWQSGRSTLWGSLSLFLVSCNKKESHINELTYNWLVRKVLIRNEQKRSITHCYHLFCGSRMIILAVASITTKAGPQVVLAIRFPRALRIGIRTTIAVVLLNLKIHHRLCTRKQSHQILHTLFQNRFFARFNENQVSHHF